MNFRFNMPVNIIFGENAHKEIGSLISYGKVLIVTDGTMVKLGFIDLVKQQLKQGAVVFDGIEPNPTVASIQAAIEYGRTVNVNCVIGIGGGSAMDAAKAVALSIPSRRTFEEHFDGSKYENGRLGLYLIPTTAGTGSEVTSVGVFTNAATGSKKPMLNAGFYADAVIVDPFFTLALPKKTTAVTGLDAFCHAIEAYWSTNSQPICDSLSVEAVNLILKNIKTAYDDGEDIFARTNMMLASLMAGMSFSQTRTTAIHGLSYSLVAHGKLDHGSACAITLPSFIKYNYNSSKVKMDRLLAYCGLESNEELICLITEILSHTGMTTRLRDADIKAESIEQIARESAAHGLSSLNPEKVDVSSLIEILESIY